MVRINNLVETSGSMFWSTKDTAIQNRMKKVQGAKEPGYDDTKD